MSEFSSLPGRRVGRGSLYLPMSVGHPTCLIPACPDLCPSLAALAAPSWPAASHETHLNRMVALGVVPPMLERLASAVDQASALAPPANIEPIDLSTPAPCQCYCITACC